MNTTIETSKGGTLKPAEQRTAVYRCEHGDYTGPRHNAPCGCRGMFAGYTVESVIPWGGAR